MLSHDVVDVQTVEAVYFPSEVLMSFTPKVNVQVTCGYAMVATKGFYTCNWKFN